MIISAAAKLERKNYKCCCISETNNSKFKWGFFLLFFFKILTSAEQVSMHLWIWILVHIGCKIFVQTIYQRWCRHRGRSKVSVLSHSTLSEMSWKFLQSTCRGVNESFEQLLLERLISCAVHKMSRNVFFVVCFLKID